MQPSNLIVHCLIDPRRESTLYQHLLEQGVQPQNIRYRQPIHAETVVRSINISHKAIVREAQHEPYVCIMEQDAYFPAPDGLRRWLNGFTPAAPLYLAGAYNVPDVERLRELQKRSGFPSILVSFTKGVEGFHVYILTRLAFEQFLTLPDDDHIDVLAINSIGCTIPWPMCAIQLAGYSSTACRWTDKNVSLDQRDVYGTIPRPQPPQ